MRISFFRSYPVLFQQQPRILVLGLTSVPDPESGFTASLVAVDAEATLLISSFEAKSFDNLMQAMEWIRQQWQASVPRLSSKWQRVEFERVELREGAELFHASARLTSTTEHFEQWIPVEGGHFGLSTAKDQKTVSAHFREWKTGSVISNRWDRNHLEKFR